MDRNRACRLIVIRHGETLWNAIGKQQGQLDTDLSELGVGQARAIAEAMVSRDVDVLYSSDLGRALQTATIIAGRLGLPVCTDARLRERHLGIMQGMTMAEFEQRHPAEYTEFRRGDLDWQLPGGESVRQRDERVVACADELAKRHAGQTVAIVTHAGVIDDLFRHAVGVSLGTPRHFSLYNAGIGTFSVRDGNWQLERWGDTDHLKEIGTQDDW